MIDSGLQRRLDKAIYWSLRGIAAFVGGVPVPVAITICRALALLVYGLDRKHRRIGRINLRMAFPNQKHDWRRRILRESFLRVADHFVEVCRLLRVSADELERRIVYEPGHGLEHYEAARARGKGVIFLTGHIGPWELLPLAHAVLGNPLNVVVRPLDNPFVDRWMTRVRSRFGNRVINKSSSLRQILRLLGRGEDVGMLIDQNVQEKDGVFVPFFGHAACTTVSPAALALRTKTPVVIGFLLPTQRRRRYRIRFYPPIEVNASEDRDSDLARYTTLFNRYIEEVITEHPDCWLWGHRRFRTQPDGSDPYR